MAIEFRIWSYLKPDLVVIDDMGLKALPANSGEYLLEVIMRRYENRSTIMCNSSFSYMIRRVLPWVLSGLPLSEKTAWMFGFRTFVIEPEAESPSVMNSVVSLLRSSSPRWTVRSSR